MIRAATSRDVSAIVALHASSILTLCRSHYSSEQLTLWTTELARLNYASLLTSHSVIVDERDGTVCGFGVFDPRSSRIHATYVDPTAAGRGVGSALMTEMMASARRCGASEVLLHATLNAVPFYEKLGFVGRGAATNRLPSGVELPCVRMSKEL